MLTGNSHRNYQGIAFLGNYLPREARGKHTYARDAVEKVAKEGRKYGVSAILISQRPSLVG